jgi:site-specific DNA-methyltransferase (adenine-specific)
VYSKNSSEIIPSTTPTSGYSAEQRAELESDAALNFAKSAYTVGDTLQLIQKVKAGCCHFAEVDPPYGIKLKGQRGRVQDQHTLESYNEIPAVDYKAFLELSAKGTFEALHENAFCVWWFGPTWYATVRQALIMVGFKVAEIPGIWYKGGVGQTNSPETHLANSYEMFFVARKGKPALAKRGRSNVFEFSPVPPKQKVHPTERPIELMEEILGTFTHPGARVIVPFLGSGVTLRAIYNGNLKGFGYDLAENNRNLYLERVKRLLKSLEMKNIKVDLEKDKQMMSHDFEFEYELPDGTEVIVEATGTSGRPMIQPSLNLPGEPAEDSEIEIVSTIIDATEIDFDDLWIKVGYDAGKAIYRQVSEDIMERANKHFENMLLDD